MSSGILVTNDNNKVLLSDYVGSIYFKDKGVVISQLVGAYFPKQNVTCGSITTYATSAVSTPIPFLKLTSSYSVVTRVYYSGGWKIEVLHLGSAPEVYVFCKAGAYTGTDTHGMQVFDSTGGVLYDSRIPKRLNVKGTSTAVWNPNNGALPYGPNLYYDTWSGQVDPSAKANKLGQWTYYVGRQFAGNYGWSYPQTYQYIDIECVNVGERDVRQYTLNVNSQLGVAAAAGDLVSFAGYAACERQFVWRSAQWFDGGIAPSDTYNLWSNVTWCVYRGGMANIGGQIVSGWIPHATNNYYSGTSKTSTVTNNDYWYVGGSGISSGTVTNTTIISSGGSGGTPAYINTSLNLNTGTMLMAASADYA